MPTITSGLFRGFDTSRLAPSLDDATPLGDGTSTSFLLQVGEGDTRIDVQGRDLVYDANGYVFGGVITSITLRIGGSPLSDFTVTYTGNDGISGETFGFQLLNGDITGILKMLQGEKIRPQIFVGSAGNDRFIALNEQYNTTADIANGDRGSDFFDLWFNNDTANGGPGADAFTLRNGFDGPLATKAVIDGGSGVDTAVFVNQTTAEDGVKIALSNTGFQQTSFGRIKFLNIENVDGSVIDADTITGNSANNVIRGDGGTDGTPTSNDVLSGGDGNDHLQGEGGADRLNGGTGNDRLLGGDNASFGPGKDVLDGGVGNDTALGGNGNDFVQGGDGNDRLEGEAGLDRLVGGAGNDRLLGGDNLEFEPGKDTLDGGEGHDTAAGGNGDDVIGGDAGNDVLQGDAGNDFISGDDGNDRITGSSGDDTLRGGAGDDTISAGTGGNRGSNVQGGDGDDILTGTKKDDTIDGGVGNDYIIGGKGNDKLSGAANDDKLQGFFGADTLNGGDGNDTLEGGEHKDTMNGGAGEDEFLFRKGYGNDRITGFDSDEDKLHFTELPGVDEFTDLVITGNGTGTVVVTTPGGESIIIQAPQGETIILNTGNVSFLPLD